MTSPVAVPRQRYAPNPRTAELPMAFTRWEFQRGVLATYLAFLVLTVCVSIWWYLVGAFFAIIFAGPIALVTTIVVGAPLSYLAGILLRRVRDHRVHYLAHAAAGCIAGFAGLTIYLCVAANMSYTMPGPPDYSEVARFPWLIVYPLLTPFSAMWGWWFTSSRALSGR